MLNISSSSFRFLPRLVFGLFLTLLFGSCSWSYSPSFGRSDSIHPVTQVNKWLYRGPQPAESTLIQLRQKGVKTIVSFREEPIWIKYEKEQVEKLKMNFVSLPWGVWKSVKPELADQLFKTLDDPKNRPVFMHCKHGRDRTGVMSVLALMRYEKLPEEDARELALETIQPNLRYRHFVSKKIDFFLSARPSLFYESVAQGPKNPEPAANAAS